MDQPRSKGRIGIGSLHGQEVKSLCGQTQTGTEKTGRVTAAVTLQPCQRPGASLVGDDVGDEDQRIEHSDVDGQGLII